jgi:xanthine dehydrogenase FAD-binding subunit
MVEALHPSTLTEALEIRRRLAAVPFAGGTDLMVKLGRGAGVLPDFAAAVLFLDRCDELQSISVKPGMLEIGSMVSLAELSESPLAHPVLREILLSMGGPGIRNAATLGGNICNASPAGDTLPFLYCFGAAVRLASAGSERTVPLEEFVTGPRATVLRQDEILRSFLIPSWSPRVAFWRKVGTRRANALTKVSAAGFADIEDGRLRRVRVALGAVAPTVRRLPDVERMLEAARVDAHRDASGDLDHSRLLVEVHAAVLAGVRPIDDQRSTSDYRRETAASLVQEFARQALAQALAPALPQAPEAPPQAPASSPGSREV